MVWKLSKGEQKVSQWRVEGAVPLESGTAGVSAQVSWTRLTSKVPGRHLRSQSPRAPNM